MSWQISHRWEKNKVTEKQWIEENKLYIHFKGIIFIIYISFLLLSVIPLVGMQSFNCFRFCFCWHLTFFKILIWLGPAWYFKGPFFCLEVEPFVGNYCVHYFIYLNSHSLHNCFVACRIYTYTELMIWKLDVGIINFL